MLFFNSKSVIGATATTERVFKNDWLNTIVKRKTKCSGNLLNKSLNNWNIFVKIYYASCMLV